MANISDYRELINEARRQLKGSCEYCCDEDEGESNHLTDELLELILKIDAGEFG